MNAELKYNPLGLLVALLLGAVVMLIADGCEAYAAPCRVCRQQQKLVVPYAAPQLAYSPLLYRVGESVRQQSVDTAAFRASPEYQEFVELRAWKAGLQYGEQLRGEAPPQPWTPQPEKPSDAAADPSFPLPSPLPEQLPRGAEPDPAEQRFAAQMPTLVARCGYCHGNKDPDNPDGGLWLNGEVSVHGADNALKRDSIMSRIMSTDPDFMMPPPQQKRLSNEELTGVIYELYGDESRALPEP